MNYITVPAPVMEDPVERIQRIFAAQQTAFKTNPFPSALDRRAKLKALKKKIGAYQDVLAQAISQDFDLRSAAETKMLDLFGSVLALNHAVRHVGHWMRPVRRSPELLFFSNSLRVMYQPKGVVGVIVPWNFPIYLAVGPLAVALAAGNRVMIKMSEVTPATNRVFAKLLGEVFQEDEVAVAGEELSDPSAFTSLPFDHIVFTGSPAVGKLVMRTAAANLTPLTLELGGKSPAILCRGYPVADAAKHITQGKAANGGQICVAPDYAWIPREAVDAFVAAAVACFKTFYGGSIAQNPDYTSVVNERQFLRIQELIADAVAKGATIVACAPYDAARDRRRMPVHIVTGCTPDMRIMKEELFAPILPIMPYDSMDEVIAFLNAADRPLAMYCFSYDAKERQALLHRTHAGGVTINDWGWHVINHDAPFGGIGHSGTGTYHGVEGFRELSHAKTVFKRHRFYPVDLFYPPYGKFAQRAILRLFLGKADVSLSGNEISARTVEN